MQIDEKRIEFLEKEIAYHNRAIMQYENCDGAGEWKNARPHYKMVEFLSNWVDELKISGAGSDDGLQEVIKKEEFGR